MTCVFCACKVRAFRRPRGAHPEVPLRHALLERGGRDALPAENGALHDATHRASERQVRRRIVAQGLRHRGYSGNTVEPFKAN